MMTSPKIYSFVILAAILLCINSMGFAQQQEKPNVLFILVDDYGWMDVGAYGSEFYETPASPLNSKGKHSFQKCAFDVKSEIVSFLHGYVVSSSPNLPSNNFNF